MKITLEDFLKSVGKKRKTDEIQPLGNDATESGDEPEKTEKDLLGEQLKQIEKAYKESNTRTYNGEKTINASKIIDALETDEEIEKRANDEEGGKAAEKEDALIKKAEEQFGKYVQKADKAEQSAKDATDKIKRDYASAVRKAENNFADRGLGRSSVKENTLDALETSENAELSTAVKTKDEAIKEIERQIGVLSDDLAKALSELDEKTAVAISEKIKSYKEKRDKTAEDARTKESEQKAALSQKGIATDEKNSQEYANAQYEKLRALYAYYYGRGENALTEIVADKEFIIENVGENGYNYLRRNFR